MYSPGLTEHPGARRLISPDPTWSVVWMLSRNKGVLGFSFAQVFLKVKVYACLHFRERILEDFFKNPVLPMVSIKVGSNRLHLL